LGYIIPPMPPMPPMGSPPGAPAGRGLGLVGHEDLGGEQQAAIDAAFCSAARVTLAGSMTPALSRSDELAGRGVEAGRAGLGLDALHDDRTLEAGVVGDEPSRSLERTVHAASTVASSPSRASTPWPPRHGPA
jgi:hypothetical protein